MTEPRSFRLTDSTLRDGSHALRHRFTAAQVGAIASALDAAGVPARSSRSCCCRGSASRKTCTRWRRWA